MTTWEMRVNVYNNSSIGHANVSFYEDGAHQYTVGANGLLETPSLALPTLSQSFPHDGIYRDESAYHLAELAAGTVTWASVPVPENLYDALLAEAQTLENRTYDYNLFTQACVDLVEQFYQKSGHPGHFGDLFPEMDQNGAMVWARVPTTLDSLLDLWPADRPLYTPDGVKIPPVPDALDPFALAGVAGPPVTNLVSRKADAFSDPKPEPSTSPWAADPTQETFHLPTQEHDEKADDRHPQHPEKTETAPSAEDPTEKVSAAVDIDTWDKADDFEFTFDSAATSPQKHDPPESEPMAYTEEDLEKGSDHGYWQDPDPYHDPFGDYDKGYFDDFF